VSNRTILHLAVLSVLLVVSLTASSHAQEKAKQKEASDPAAKDAVPAMIETLKDKDTGVRKSAALALGLIGPAAKDAVPALIEALKDGDPGDRRSDG
jgi:HEAT repeat protein